MRFLGDLLALLLAVTMASGYPTQRKELRAGRVQKPFDVTRHSVPLERVVIGLVVVLGGVAILKESSEGDSNSALPGRVLAEEHGHWHTVSPGQSGSATRPISQPGPAPPGKVWSAQHGHWHDAAPEATPEGSGTATTPQSP